MPERSLPLHHPLRNCLLAALPQAEFASLQADLELVPLAQGAVLCEAGVPLTHVHFPLDALIALHYVLEDGSSSEMALVGHEGMLGVALFMGGDTTSCRAVVQCPGWGYRMEAQRMRQAFRRAGPLMYALLRYTQAMITELAQTAVCRRHHSLEQQLSRWLLLSLDRLPEPAPALGPALAAKLLGAEQRGLHVALASLQRAGCIDYADGRLAVPDRAALEQHVCECYAVVRMEFARLLAPPAPAEPPAE